MLSDTRCQQHIVVSTQSLLGDHTGIGVNIFKPDFDGPFGQCEADQGRIKGQLNRCTPRGALGSVGSFKVFLVKDQWAQEDQVADLFSMSLGVDPCQPGAQIMSSEYEMINFFKL